MSKDEVINYITNTETRDVSGSINHYKFPIAGGCEILLSQSCYERLIQLTAVSAFRGDEHMTLLYGIEERPNQIYFSKADTARDYKIGRTEVISGPGQMEEAKRLVENHQGEKNLIICDVHTHPYGVLKNPDGSPSLQHNFFSSSVDLGGPKIAHYRQVRDHAQRLGKNVDVMSGLIAIDNDGGNSMISFVCLIGDRYYRLNNVKVVDRQSDGSFTLIKDLNDGQFDYIEENFNME